MTSSIFSRPTAQAQDLATAVRVNVIHGLGIPGDQFEVIPSSISDRVVVFTQHAGVALRIHDALNSIGIETTPVNEEHNDFSFLVG